MAEPLTDEVTQLLKAWTAGDEQALEKLTPLVYRQLHRVAQRCMAGERSGHTLQTTALVNEVYLQLVDCGQINWQDRAHFFAVSARLMRRILIDFARSRGYQKRGGGVTPLSLDDVPSVGNKPDANLVALDDALKALAAVDERKSRVVELKFFGGLSVEETAEVLKVSKNTVVRDWRLAKVWLLRELTNKEFSERESKEKKLSKGN
jgi:RNA polymerase sigma-70 factor, ECF subfamily